MKPKTHGLLAVGVTLAAVASLAACSGGAPNPAGVWTASDGSGTKTINDDGACTGMYYDAGQPLDIGGGMTCTFGSEQSADGTYTLVVDQPPNSATYRVQFDGDDTLSLLGSGGSTIVTLTRS
jgi:uncharacterized protein (DUF2147 family)